MAVDRRQQIIEAAAKSFSMFGYKATTMDQVAKLANVGKGTIYTFFKNKEELFDEIISSLIKEMKEAADSSIDPSFTFQENVHKSLISIFGFREKHQLTIKLLQEEREMGTPAVIDTMNRLEQAIISYIKARISEAIHKGELKECDPELAAFIIVKLYFALVFDWTKNHEPLSKEKIASLLDQYIFKGLSSR